MFQKTSSISAFYLSFPKSCLLSFFGSTLKTPPFSPGDFLIGLLGEPFVGGELPSFLTFLAIF